MEATSTQKIDKQSGKSGRIKPWIGGFIALSLMLLALWFVLSGAEDKQVTWLTPKEFKQAVKSGASTKFFRRLFSPVERWLARHRNQPNVNIRSSLVALKSPLQNDILGPALSTNSNGLRAWILRADEFDRLESSLKKMDYIDEISAPRVVTASGMIAQIATQSSFDMTLKPRISDDSILLSLNASYWVLARSTNDAASSPKLGFEAVCRATIPDGGAIVIEGRNPTNADGSDYLLMLTPTEVDATGKRVYPKR